MCSKTCRRHTWGEETSIELSLDPVVPPTGGITVTHTGLPIRVLLANTDMSFSCKIHNFLGTEIFMFTVSFFYMDIHGEKSSEKPIACQPRPGMENQTMDCMVQLSLPNASATGTYYCRVKGHVISQSDGIFILVRGKASSHILPGRRNVKPPAEPPAIPLSYLPALQTEQKHPIFRACQAPALVLKGKGPRMRIFL